MYGYELYEFALKYSDLFWKYRELEMIGNTEALELAGHFSRMMEQMTDLLGFTPNVR